MENKQTAVEWLKEKLPSLFQDDSGHYKKLFEQAKAMEKEQIMESHEQAYIEMNMAFRGADRAEQYYNETYGE
jgi:hypothetical protein